MSGPFFRVLRLDPFPPRREVSLNYSNAFTLTNGTTNVIGTEFAFSLNSLFDPNNSGGGTQPYGFDTMATIYNKYKVKSVLVELKCSLFGTDPTLWVISIVEPSVSTITLTGGALDTFLDKPYTHVLQLSGGGNKQFGSYRQVFNIAAIDGLTDKEFDANLDDYTALVSADPAALPILRIASVGTNAQTCACVIRMTFNAEFYDRKILAQS